MAEAIGYPAPRVTGGDGHERRGLYQNTWRVGAVEALCRLPLGFCAAVLCAPCVAFHQRERVLYGDMSRYTCCNGAFPCSGRLGEQNCPEFCLAMEVLYCFPSSVATTRFMIQDQEQIQNGQCDNCLIGTQFALAQCACLCSVAACISGSEELNELANLLTGAADIGWCLLCGCLMAQQGDALNVRDSRYHTRDVMVTPPDAMAMKK